MARSRRARGPGRAAPRALAFLALLLAGATAPARADGLSLHVIETRLRPGARPRPGEPLRIAAYSERPTELARALSGAAAPALAADHVELELREYPQLEPLDPEGYRAASFVLDYDAPAVAALRAELVRRHGEEPAPEALRTFASEWIGEKSMRRGFDLASQVAASRTGDCTEHAVLLAALARSVGWPARVVLGIAVLSDGERYASVGHAWAEIHAGGAWRVADAALGPEIASVAYLPTALLADEGPGYALRIMQGLQTAWVSRIEILGSAR